jgi:hypothetical protein
MNQLCVPNRNRAEIVLGNQAYKSIEHLELHKDFKLPNAYSVLMCINVITTQKTSPS